MLVSIYQSLRNDTKSFHVEFLLKQKTEKITQFRQCSAILLPCSNCSTISSLGHSALNP